MTGSAQAVWHGPKYGQVLTQSSQASPMPSPSVSVPFSQTCVTHRTALRRSRYWFPPMKAW